MLVAGGLAGIAAGDLERTLLASLLPRAKSLSYGVARNAHCFGIVHSEHMAARVLCRIAATLPAGVTEIIVHPGETSPGELDPALSPADQQFLASPWRKRELAALLDPKVGQAFASCKAELESANEVSLVAA